jgi:hypothetical protein
MKELIGKELPNLKLIPDKLRDQTEDPKQLRSPKKRELEDEDTDVDDQ